MYVDLVDEADKVACITLAFGINKRFKDLLKDNTPSSHITFLLLEKEDKPNPSSNDGRSCASTRRTTSTRPGARSCATRSTSGRRRPTRGILGSTTHVSYIHSKFLLQDPLGADPIVVTGSANFSDASTNDNDENMLVIRGDQRVADIYFTEFNRLFNHYYFRSVEESTKAAGRDEAAGSLFLKENDGMARQLQAGSLKQKRVDMFAGMKGFA